MDKGSRLLNLLQQLERVIPSRTSKLDGEDKQQLRSCTARIQACVNNDKTSRDLIIGNAAYVDTLLTALEVASDGTVEQNIVYCLLDLIGKSNTSKRVTTLVAHGATHILLQVLVYEARDPSYSEELLLSIHQLLSKLGPKDRKLGVKARLCQALPISLNLLKNYATSPKNLQPVLHVVKLYSSNAVNASYLGKNGCVSYIFKVLSACGRKHSTIVKNALDTLAQLVKSKSNAARAIGQGGMAMLLNMFDDWHRIDTKNRHIPLRKAILTCIKHITNLKAGRKAFIDCAGIRILYACCEDLVDSREVETIVLMASVIMRKSFPKNRLPVSALKSVLSFTLPQSDFHTLDTGEGHGDDNEYESSIDNDDDISSEDEVEANKLDSDEYLDGFNGGPAPERTAEDLAMYDRIFAELTEFDPLLDDDLCLGPSFSQADSRCVTPLMSHVPPPVIPPINSTTSTHSTTSSGTGSSSGPSVGPSGSAIVIPTATIITSDSGISSGSGRSRRCPTPGSSRTGSSRANQSGSVTNRASPVIPAHGSTTTTTGHASGHARITGLVTGSNIGSSTASSSSESSLVGPAVGPSAINLKTGTSVFSLNLSPGQNRKASVQYSNGKSRQRMNRLVSQKSLPTPKSERRSGRGHSRGHSRQRSDDEWLPANGMLTDRTAASPALAHGSSTDIFSSEDSGTTSPDYDSDDQSSYKGPHIYSRLAEKTKCVGRFNKLAYPDMYGSTATPFKEPLYEKPFGIQRTKVFEDIDRFVNPELTMENVVYDLDRVVAKSGPTFNCLYNNLVNKDDLKICPAHEEPRSDGLKFNAQFESGNLRKAIQVRRYEYDLVLSPDLNTNHHHQWFYFEVSNMDAGVRYRFNIINCEKLNSQFNFGMRPLLYSVKEAVQGRPHWVRAGSEIAYYKNHFVRSAQTTGGVRGKSYYTATFTLVFQHESDVCYLAYHYPYTYTTLQSQIYAWENLYDSTRIYFRHDTLCETLAGNSVPVLTITAHPPSYDRCGIEQFKSRPYIFLTARVHPGESNASWVMKGSINFLMSNRPAARALREAYVFKIVPMLNPDGVIHGSHRCSLVAEDLNRRWAHPCPKLHPTIYHTKGLLQYLKVQDRVPLVFCDYHGHSRRKNVFLYGCSPSLSWMNEDVDNPANSGNKLEDTAFKTLPRLLHTIAPAFSQSNCSYVVEKNKETTARVVVWRQIGVVRSYTMESSYCGCDQGPYRGYHIGTKELEEMGQKFCEGLLRVRSRHVQSVVGAGLSATSSQTNLAALAQQSQLNTSIVQDSSSDHIDGSLKHLQSSDGGGGRGGGGVLGSRSCLQLSSNSTSSSTTSNSTTSSNHTEDEDGGA